MQSIPHYTCSSFMNNFPAGLKSPCLVTCYFVPKPCRQICMLRVSPAPGPHPQLGGFHVSTPTVIHRLAKGIGEWGRLLKCYQSVILHILWQSCLYFFWMMKNNSRCNPLLSQQIHASFYSCFNHQAFIRKHLKITKNWIFVFSLGPN